VKTEKERTSPDPQELYFGTRVSPRTFSQWLADISNVLASGQRGWLSGHHNLHSLSMLQRDSDVRRFYLRCNDCYVDGTPVRIILRGFGVATAAEQRFSLMDRFMELLQHAEENRWSIFYLGSKEAEVNLARERFSTLFPDLRIKLEHGYNPEQPTLIHTINAWRPDILLVGMGMPLQERWILRHLDQLDAGVVAQAGATLDYYTGAQARPPLWLSRAGLAWLYRLIHDPVRLGRRYLIEPWTLLYPTLRQWYRFRSLRRGP
jgi:N-acetylglucosaminyldiphosphoundecaprenol N-acetyl-beta-D-mannosaminyltransferase